jgi:hypothetical protein
MFRRDTKGKLDFTQESLSLLKVTPSVPALARTVDPTISASTEITLNAATSFISVYAFVKDVYLKWGTDDVTASNFDEVIPAGQIINFLVPSAITALNVIERESGAGVVVLER